MVVMVVVVVYIQQDSKAKGQKVGRKMIHFGSEGRERIGGRGEGGGGGREGEEEGKDGRAGGRNASRKTRCGKQA